MSVKEVTYYQCVCDWPGCTNTAQEGSEYAAWSNPDDAVGDAENGDWRRNADNTLHYCDEHPATWASDHEDGEPYPDPPYLLIHDGDTEDDGDDGCVTLIEATP